MNSFHAFSLAARRRKRSKATTRPGKGRWRAPDQVKRKFAASGINRRWYCDGTEIPTGKEAVPGQRAGHGLAPGRRVRAHHDAALAYGALAMAVAVRGGAVPGVVFHTDQGVHRRQLPGHVREARDRPVGRPTRVGAGQRGHRVVVLDPEFELRSLRSFATRAAARTAVAAWIEGYNHVRRHSALGMRCPVDYERSLAGKDAACTWCDNYGTHKTPEIQDWLARHPQFHVHFTTTGSSWINQVERWFGLPD